MPLKRALYAISCHVIQSSGFNKVALRALNGSCLHSKGICVKIFSNCNKKVKRDVMLSRTVSRIQTLANSILKFPKGGKVECSIAYLHHTMIKETGVPVSHCCQCYENEGPSFQICKRYIRGAIKHDKRPLKRNEEDAASAETSDDEGSRYSPLKEYKSQTLDREEQQFAAPRTRKVRDLLDNSALLSEMRADTARDVWSRPPYVKEEIKRQQGQYVHEEQGIDPDLTTVMLFPGQGVQYVGMAKEFLKYPNVRRMYAIASEILGYDLLDVCQNGPKQDLNRTLFCQPAVVVTSLAAVEKLKDESPNTVDSCVAAAGFSVGEITALIFAGALSFEEGIKLVRIRAEAMQGASELTISGMMSVFYGADARIGFACSAAREWCRRQGIDVPECTIANYLYPGCKVIAGHDEALKFIILNAKEFGIRRYKRLPVSGAFHTSLMFGAQQALKEAMKQIQVSDPIISVYSNVDGKRYRNADHIKKQLPKQICAPVKWEQTLHALYERPVGTNFPRTYECGPGHSLQTILKQVNIKAYDRMVVMDDSLKL